MKICIKNFNLNQLAESGQCFRWKKINENEYMIPAFGRALYISNNGKDFELSCDEEEFNNYWLPYFDLSRDYDSIEKRIISGKDSHLKTAFEFGNGIRILKQDTWEIIISFMISQNNNIKRISKSIELICERCGYKTLNDNNVYRFPEAHEIDIDIFNDTSLGLGYRADYLKDICKFVTDNPDWINYLKTLSFENAYEELLKRKGIGPKVSNCICLFGLAHVEAFPIDTHVKQLIAKHYPNGIDLSLFPKEAGIIQQYLFYYDLKNSKGN